jgi:hypothetical protein
MTDVSDDLLLPGATRDGQSIDAAWQFTGRKMIDGVAIKDVRHVPTGYGFLTEVWRRDWKLDDFAVDQVFQSTLAPAGISAWHAHAETTDRLFVAAGLLRIVLYDARAAHRRRSARSPRRRSAPCAPRSSSCRRARVARRPERRRRAQPPVEPCRSRVRLRGARSLAPAA